MKAHRILVALPLSGPWVYWRTVGGILGQKRPFECALQVVQVGFVDAARNELVERMFKHPLNPTHLFFVDSDIVLPPDALVRLVEGDVPIVSGLYRGRRPPHAPIAYVRNRRGGYRSIAAKGKARVVVDAVGAGCLLIRRDVLETLKAPWFVDGYQDGVFFTEDFFFCRQAQAAGFEIRVDRRVRPLHIEAVGVGDAAGTARLQTFA